MVDDLATLEQLRHYALALVRRDPALDLCCQRGWALIDHVGRYYYYRITDAGRAALAREGDDAT